MKCGNCHPDYTVGCLGDINSAYVSCMASNQEFVKRTIYALSCGKDIHGCSLILMQEYIYDRKETASPDYSSLSKHQGSLIKRKMGSELHHFRSN